MILLVNPPVVKPSEPPPGIARLFGALTSAGVRCRVLDANIEGLLALIHSDPHERDTWTTRAAKNRDRNLDLLRSGKGYANAARYGRAVSDLNRLVESVGKRAGVRLGLGNFQHDSLSPLRSADLLRAAEHPEGDPFYSYFSGRLRELFEAEAPSFIGLSLNYLSQALTAFAMLGFIRKNLPSVPVALGGGLITSWMRRPGWRNPFCGLADHVVEGPGERFFFDLFGIESEAAHFTPGYSAFPMARYFSPGAILPYSASDGCYWNKCAFCPERAEANPYLPAPPGTVAEDLRRLVNETRPALIHLCDSAVSPALMKTLAGAPPGVPWYGFARVTGHLADPGFCRDLKKSGCVMLKLGIESGDQDVIDSEAKGIDLTVASRALKALKEAGVSTYVYFLFGTPSETESAARKTLAFAETHAEEIGFLNLAIFNMPVNGAAPGGLSTSLLYEGDLSLYTGFRHPKGWHRGVVRQFLDKEFKRRPKIAPILARDPPVFTSSHAPFFCGPPA